MANELITPTMITKEAVKEAYNQAVLIKKVDRQMDLDGKPKKNGGSIEIRRNVRFLSGNGQDISSTIRDTTEGSITMSLDNWRHVAMKHSKQDLTLTIEDFSKRYIKPAVTELVQYVESQIASLYYNFYWFVGTPGTGPSTYLHLGEAEATLDMAGVPFDERCIFVDPFDMINLADGLKGQFNNKAKVAIEKSSIGMYANFDVIKCQSIATHTVGVATGTPLVNGGSQNVTYSSVRNSLSQTLNTDGWTNSITGILKQGDVFTIADVYAVNPRTRQSTGKLQTFTVLADADSGASTGPAALTISPAIITSGAYQTVDSAPADNAAITVKTGTGGNQYKQNIGFCSDAITMGCAIIEIDENDAGVKSWHEEHEGLSITYSQGGNINTLESTKRLDILFGLKVQNPGFGIRRTS